MGLEECGFLFFCDLCLALLLADSIPIFPLQGTVTCGTGMLLIFHLNV